MTLTTENILLIGSILLFVSLLAGKTSYKLGVPVLIFFLAIGMLAGSEGIGGVYFNNPKTAQFIGIVALNFILFSGGLDTEWQSVKHSLLQGITLSTCATGRPGAARSPSAATMARAGASPGSCKTWSIRSARGSSWASPTSRVGPAGCSPMRPT